MGKRISKRKLMEIIDTGKHTLKGIYRELGIKKKEDRRKLRKILKELQSKGEIYRDSKGRYRRIGDSTVLGTIEFTKKGTAAFLVTPKGEDIFIPVENVGNAMHGDRVIVEIVGKKGDMKKGRVLKVVERGFKKIVGIFKRRGMFGYVIPIDPKIIYDFRIPTEELGKAKPGQIVVAKITQYPTRRKEPMAEIVEVLGYEDDPSIDFPVVVMKHNLPLEFPKEVMEEVKKLKMFVDDEDIDGRWDLRNKIIFTIDGEDAKDFDDAVSIEKLKNGNYLLGVHIADVSHYVKEGTALDREAYNRGTSVYLIDKVIPMLPFELSNGICSLIEGEDRLTFSVFMEIDEDGETINYEFGKSVIRSKKRLTYEQVNRLFSGDEEQKKILGDEVVNSLFTMRELSKILRENRKRRGAIVDIETDEVKVILNEKGKPLDIIPRSRGDSEKLIEEFMIRANETVAEVFDRFDLPFIYRVHEEPDPEGIMELKYYLKTLGLKLKIPKKIHPRILQELLEKMSDHPLRRTVERLLVRSMKRAMYSEVNIGHFGLASYSYTHFTSPIRRYPDLIAHRLLNDFLKRRRFSDKELRNLRKKLAIMSKHCSRRERVADEAEWDMIDMKKVDYAKERIGEVFNVVVTAVTGFGLFVEIVEKGINGLIHISSLDDYYIYDEENQRLIGKNNGRILKLGDELKAKIVGANKMRMEVDFELQD